MKLRGKRVLVSGGAGFIGSHLVDRLIEEDPAAVVVVDNFFLGQEENLDSALKRSQDTKVCRLDAADLAAMKELIENEKIDVVFNMAVIPLPTSLNYPAWTAKTNIDTALALCDLLRWDNYQTLVHCSSSEVYGTGHVFPMDENQPLLASTPYAASKAAADQLVFSYHRTFGLDTVIVRPFNNFGPRQNDRAYAGIIPIIVANVKRGEPIRIFGDGEQTRDYIFVRETADAFVRAYEEKQTRGKVINIASGVETSINELVRIFLTVMGHPDHPIVYKDARPGDVLRHRGDIQLAEKLFGFKPSVFDTGHVKETVDWYLRRIE